MHLLLHPYQGEGNAAIRLDRRAGYDCLNTVTIRKDFSSENHRVICREKICDQDFEVKQYIK